MYTGRRAPSARRNGSSCGIWPTGPSGGSAARLVLQALAAKEASPEELAEIREWLAEQEGKREGAR